MDLLQKETQEQQKGEKDDPGDMFLNSPNAMPKRPTCARIKYEMETCCDKAFDDLRHLHNAGGPPGGGGGGLFGNKNNNNNNGNGNDILYDYTKIPSYFKPTEDEKSKEQNPIQAIISKLFGTKSTSTSTSKTSSSKTTELLPSRIATPPAASKSSSSTTISAGTSGSDSTFLHVPGFFAFLSLFILGIVSYTGMYHRVKRSRRRQQQLSLQYPGGDQDKEQETVIIMNRSRGNNNEEEKLAGGGITTKYGSI